MGGGIARTQNGGGVNQRAWRLSPTTVPLRSSLEQIQVALVRLAGRAVCHGAHRAPDALRKVAVGRTERESQLDLHAAYDVLRAAPARRTAARETELWQVVASCLCCTLLQADRARVRWLRSYWFFGQHSLPTDLPMATNLVGELTARARAVSHRSAPRAVAWFPVARTAVDTTPKIGGGDDTTTVVWPVFQPRS